MQPQRQTEPVPGRAAAWHSACTIWRAWICRASTTEVIDSEKEMAMEQTDTGQSGTTVPVSDKNKKTISDYVGDMAALESHIEEALDRQLDQVKDDPVALTAVRGFHDMVKSQRDRMKELQGEVGSTAGSPIKQAGSTLLGMIAGIVDRIRTEGNSKALRDDYTAFNLAAMGYTMLFTTATALGDQRVAGIAEQHLRGYSGAVQQINQVIGDVVVTELRKDGHEIQGDPVNATRRTVNTAWKQTAPHGAQA
jgi:ferritin-like metal-binding protein YciE